jgi:hypothetical protein
MSTILEVEPEPQTKDEQHKSKRKYSTSWITPKWIIDAIGLSDLDPCGFKLNGEFITKCAHDSYTLHDKQDGLALDWHGSVYCNPPYNNTRAWAKKCRQHHEDTGHDVIMLIKCSSGTSYFQNEISHATGIVLLRQRLSFLDESGNDVGKARFASILVAFGETAFDRIKNVEGVAARIDQVVGGQTC